VGIILLLWTPPVVTLVSLFMPMIRQHGAANSNNANRSDNDNTNARTEDINSNVITILVANFQGPDPQNYLVADKIIQRLQAATSGYSDISIQPLAETITEQTGSKGGSAYARDLGAKRNASIVLWGFYGVTSEKVDVSVHYEVLRKPARLSLRQNLKTETLPISDLNDFTIQTRLSGEMTYLVLLTVGLARFESGDYDAAIDRFTKALAQSNTPEQLVDPADIYFYRGLAHYYRAGVNGIDLAIADYTETIRREPDLADTYYNRGLAYAKKGQFDSAIADYTDAIRRNPDLAEAYNSRGIAHARQEQYDSAIADYTDAIRRNPDLVQAYTNRGLAYYGKGQDNRAMEDYAEAIRRNPDLAEAYNSRGLVYEKHKQYDSAIAEFTEAIRRNPDLPQAYINRGLARAKKWQYDSAIADYTEAINRQLDLDEDYLYNLRLHTIYYHRGYAYAMKLQFDSAIADYTEAIELKSDDPDAYFNRAGAYQLNGETEGAIADLKSIIRISNDPEIRHRAEQRLRELGVK
jgi:tetratricopeptide (TPR) repeat protein